MAADQLDDEPAALTAPGRAALERIAYARPASPTDSVAAAEALRQLVEADDALHRKAPKSTVDSTVDSAVDSAAGSPAVETHAPKEPGGELRNGEPPDREPFDHRPFDRQPPGPQRRPFSRPVIALIAAGLLVGVGTGVVVARANPDALTTGSPSTRAPHPSATPGASTHGADAIAALAELAGPQTAADTFPLTSFAVTLDLDPASTHRILTASDGTTLWIARASADICLLFTEAKSAAAGSTCATPQAFDEDGLKLGDGSDEFGWTGMDFTSTLTR